MRKFLFCGRSLLLAVLFLLLLSSPQAAFNGAVRGLRLWCLTLVPSLLPFLILAELLLSSGLVERLGRLLEAVMRPLFHLPGACAFGLALGFTSGFPMGAIAAASLVRERLCTAAEAARLAAFTNNSSPLFLLAAVAVGLLGQPQVGMVLLLAHYGANLLLGIILGRFAPKPPPAAKRPLSAPSLSFGAMLSSAVRRGIDSILNIGGFVTLFSVIIALGERVGFFAVLNALLEPLLGLFAFPPQTAQGVSFGLFEMTLGAQEISTAAAPLLVKLLLISFILGWGGLSVHAQVAAILAQENISVKYFLLLRPLQGLLSAFLTLPLFYFLFARPQAVGAFFEQNIASSPLFGSLIITLLPLMILFFTILLLWLFNLGCRLLGRSDI